MNRVYQMSDDDFKKLVMNSTSYLQCSLALGYTKNGRHPYDLIKKRCSELNISTDHFHRTRSSEVKKYDLNEMLVENSTYTNLTRLKIRVINAGLLKYECAICGNPGVWNGKDLSLQLDHINGKHNDNRIENLRLLCPNCHSQTETFGSKNQK